MVMEEDLTLESKHAMQCTDDMLGGPQVAEFIYKNCVFIFMCLNFSHLQSTLQLMEYTY